jgi:hypothetical protein
MIENRKKEFITRLAVMNLKARLNIIKDISAKERIIELEKIIEALNNDQLIAIKSELQKFAPELIGIQTANREAKKNNTYIYNDVINRALEIYQQHKNYTFVS